MFSPKSSNAFIQLLSKEAPQLDEVCSEIIHYGDRLGEDANETMRKIVEDVVSRLTNHVEIKRAQCKKHEEQIVKETEQLKGEFKEMGEEYQVMMQEILQDTKMDGNSVTYRGQLFLLAACREKSKKLRVERQKMLKERVSQIEALCTEMGRNSDMLEAFREDLSMGNMERLDGMIKQLVVSKQEQEAKLLSLCNSIDHLQQFLCVQPGGDEIDRLILRANVSALMIHSEEVERREKELLLIESKRVNDVFQYAKQIAALWDELEVPMDEQNGFYERNPGLGPHVIQSCIDELQRLQGLKTVALLAEIVYEDRRLPALWKKLPSSVQKRMKKEFKRHLTDHGLLPYVKNPPGSRDDLIPLVFDPYLSRAGPLSSDEKNQLLELSLEWRLEQDDRVMKVCARKLEQLISFREHLRNDAKHLRELKADTSRMQRRDYVHLLKTETKLASKVKKLPSVEKELITEIRRWEKNMQREFLVQGRRYLAVIEEERRAEEAEKEERKRNKSAARAAKSSGRTSRPTNGRDTAAARTRAALVARKENRRANHMHSSAKTSRTMAVNKVQATPSSRSSAVSSCPSTAQPADFSLAAARRRRLANERAQTPMSVRRKK